VSERVQGRLGCLGVQQHEEGGGYSVLPVKKQSLHMPADINALEQQAGDGSNSRGAQFCILSSGAMLLQQRELPRGPAMLSQKQTLHSPPDFVAAERRAGDGRNAGGAQGPRGAAEYAV